MTSVQHPELHQFKRPDIRYNLDTDILEIRPAGGKLVFDDPLGERFGDDRPGIIDSVCLGERASVFIRGRGNDPVDHGGGKSDFSINKVSQQRVAHPREMGNHAGRRFSICRKIVTG